MPPHRVTYEADYVEPRSRLTTFFRLILVVPHLIVLSLYAIAAFVVDIVAWFALVFTARFPHGIYEFIAGYLRYQTRVYGYMHLLTDVYPPFTGSDAPEVEGPVRLRIPPPKPQYSRLKALFRVILLIPVYLIAYAMQIVAEIGAVLAWFAIVALGRQPRGLQDMINLGLSYQLRATAYWLLLTEDWPSFTDEPTSAASDQRSFGAQAPREVATTAPAAGTFAPPSSERDDDQPPPPTPPLTG